MLLTHPETFGLTAEENQSLDAYLTRRDSCIRDEEAEACAKIAEADCRYLGQYGRELCQQIGEAIRARIAARAPSRY